MIEFGARLTLQDQMSATLVRNIQAQRQFQEAIDSTRSSLEQMTGGNYSTDVDVDTSAAQQQVDQIHFLPPQRVLSQMISLSLIVLSLLFIRELDQHKR